MKRYLSLLFLISFFLHNFAQKDSIRVYPESFDFERKKLYFPTGLMVAGIILDDNGENSIKNQIVKFRNKNFAYGHESYADDYIQYLPFVALYGFEWMGMEPRHDWKTRTKILIKGELINLVTLYLIKACLNQKRPDGSDYSFPSGHTANAFAGATILSIEYGEQYKWVPYAAYATASTVGIMRMINNKHYISDVLFGAGMGILSMKLGYWLHQKTTRKKEKTKDPLEGKYY